MKRRDLINKLKASAKQRGLEYTEVEGGKHTKVGIGGKQTTVPRHNEIAEGTAKAILKQMGVE